MVEINGGGLDENLNVQILTFSLVSAFAVFLLVIFVYVNKKWRFLNVGTVGAVGSVNPAAKQVPVHSNKIQYRSKLDEDYAASSSEPFEAGEDLNLKRHQTQSYYHQHHVYNQHHHHHDPSGEYSRHQTFSSSSSGGGYYQHLPSHHHDDDEELPESEGLYSTVRDSPILRESSIMDKRMTHQHHHHQLQHQPQHHHQTCSHTPPPHGAQQSQSPTASSHHHHHHQTHVSHHHSMSSHGGGTSSSSYAVAHHPNSPAPPHGANNNANASSSSCPTTTTVPSNNTLSSSSNVKSSTPLTASPGQGSCHSNASHGHSSHRQGHPSSSSMTMVNGPGSDLQQNTHHVIQHHHHTPHTLQNVRPLRVSSIRDVEDAMCSRRRPHHKGFTRSNTGPGRMMSGGSGHDGGDLISLAEEGKVNGGTTGSESSTSSNASADDDLHHNHNHHAHNLHHLRNDSSTLFHPHPLTLRNPSSSTPPAGISSSNNTNNNNNHNTSTANYSNNNNSNINTSNHNTTSSTTNATNNSVTNNPNNNINNNNSISNQNPHPHHHNSSTTSTTANPSSSHQNPTSRGDVVVSQRNNPVISRSVAASSVNANHRRIMSMPPRIKSVDSESPPPSEQELSTYGDSIADHDDHIFEVEEMSLVGGLNMDVNRVPSGNLPGSCGSLEVAFDYEAAARKMTVHIIQARGVPCKDIGGANNTQVRIVLLPSRKVKHKTKVLPGENPKFMESFVFSKINPEDVSSYGIRFRLYGCERIRRERLLGECILMFESLHLELETMLTLVLEPRYHLQWKSRSQDLCRSDSASSTASIQNGIPELLIGLAYNGTTGRLTVEVIKGSFFRNLFGGKAPDSYVKLVLVSSSGHDMGRAKTSLRRSHSNPLFKETFMFQVALFQISEVTLLVSTYGRKGVTRRELLGWFAFGNSSSGDEETTHWEDMCDAQGDQICRWHVLLQS